MSSCCPFSRIAFSASSCYPFGRIVSSCSGVASFVVLSISPFPSIRRRLHKLVSGEPTFPRQFCSRDLNNGVKKPKRFHFKTSNCKDCSMYPSTAINAFLDVGILFGGFGARFEVN